ncbi:hypothetical protein D9615_009087 [Tricholomella constricta]|uniref:Uncharacterized protein n=1 Tax=Tricholomella constricta TaxID=117010 RepID=A0A8H5H001_9AGAR|nr:hypothetical protein D9615_009087 [Tricholomella constricta]
MSKTTSSELSQVSALFKDCISIIKSRPAGDLDGAAEEWLRDARLDIMQQVKKSYQKLAESINNPLNTPRWAIDPSKHLTIYTKEHPYSLNAYSGIFLQDFYNLMGECAFDATVTCNLNALGEKSFYAIKIKLTVAGAPNAQQSSISSPSEAMKRFKKLPRFSAKVLQISQVIEDSDGEIGEGTREAGTGADKNDETVASPIRRSTRSQGAKRQRTQDEAGHGEGSTGTRRSKRLRGSTEGGKKKSRAKK